MESESEKRGIQGAEELARWLKEMFVAIEKSAMTEEDFERAGIRVDEILGLFADDRGRVKRLEMLHMFSKLLFLILTDSLNIVKTRENVTIQ